MNQGRSGLYVKNSRELMENIKNWRVDENKILVSYDVKNLYPSIPIDEALQLVEKLLKENKTLKNVTTLSVRSIMELLKWMFGLTYCEFQGQHYVFESGLNWRDCNRRDCNNLYGRISNSSDGNVCVPSESMVLVCR